MPSAVTYWSDLSHHEWDGLWLSHPAVRPRINRRVTGDEALWPIQWLRSLVPERVPFGRAISIGCGVGNLERSLADHGLVQNVTGIDESGEAIVAARRAADAGGYSDVVRYERAEAREYLARQRDLDAVFFHASLHHFDRLGELLRLVHDALGPRGILYCDEYVGPSRDEWRLRHLLRWNLVYFGLPRQVRRTRIVRAPINQDDPTEAIRSSQIVPVIESTFRVLARRDYGGNLLSVIYPNLRAPSADDAAPGLLDQVVVDLLEREEILMHSEPGYCSVIVAERR